MVIQFYKNLFDHMRVTPPPPLRTAYALFWPCLLLTAIVCPRVLRYLCLNIETKIATPVVLSIIC